MERGVGLSELALVSSAAQAAQNQGYHLVMWFLQTNEPQELRELLTEELVDGIIMTEVHNNDWRFPLLKASGIPSMALGRDDSVENLTYIDVDFKETMLASLSYLKSLGHRKVVFVNQAEQALKDGYGPVVRMHSYFDYFCRNFDIEGREIFSAKPLPLFNQTEENPTAALVMNDRILPVVINAVREQGKTIGRDFSLVSLVSSEGASRFVFPPLTSFEMNSDVMLGAAVSQLVAKIEGRYAELNTRLIPCVFQDRGSVVRIS
jgi:LacI family transcriptional regulator